MCLTFFWLECQCSLERLSINFLTLLFLSEANVDAFEGDIVLTEKDLEIVNLRNYGGVDGPLHSKSKRAAKRARQGLWKSREIPYEIDQVLSKY